jgi:hypothetical protein
MRPRFVAHFSRSAVCGREQVSRNLAGGLDFPAAPLTKTRQGVE